MSEDPTRISNEIYNYIEANFSADDAFLIKLKEEATEARLPEISISPVQARLLQLLVKSVQARHVLEIGSLGGYSAIVIARVLPPGSRLTALEIMPERAEFICRKVNEAGLGNIIKVHSIAGLEFLDTFDPAYPLDFVFIDADKVNYREYFEKTSKLLRPGGIIAADNAFAFGHIAETEPEYEPHNVKAMQEYNRYVLGRQDFLTAIVPLGDGMIVSLKL